MTVKFDTIKNPSYVATVVRIEEGDLYSVLGLDNLKGFMKFGMQALTSKDTEPGLYILFSTEVQLSQEFAWANNLHREGTLNAVDTEVGYLETNRRVKAIKLKGNRSESLLMPIDSLSYLLLPKEIDQLREGDVFDSINGREICRKYMVKEPKQNGNQPKARVRRVDEKVFPQHIDSENYFRNSDKVPADAHVDISQKLHGTSVRYGNVLALADQKWWERLLRRPRRTEYRFVVGSRRTVKSVDFTDDGYKNHWFAAGDLWTRYADQHKLADVIPRDFIVYGELVGWAGPGQPIQSNYTYDVPEGEARLYVYRVAMVSVDGHLVDMPVLQMEQWCGERGLHVVPRFQAGPHRTFKPEGWLDVDYYKDWVDAGGLGVDFYANQPVPLSGKKTVDEGVCVRYDGPHGVYVLKAKSPKFLAHETKMLDAEVEDLEAAA